jgi:mRNA-degrading endonuclease YafQ of YafQ-DinJ toxin-antitoxin module
MYALQPRVHFLRKSKKVMRRNVSLRSKIDTVLALMITDPFAEKLQTHKVQSRYDDGIAFSSRVSKDMRIIWRFTDGVCTIIDLIDIGGHSGSKKVYR